MHACATLRAAAPFQMLDDSTAASPLLKRVKSELHSLILSGDELSNDYLERLVPTGANSIVSALRMLGSPMEGLRLLLARMRELVQSLEVRRPRPAPCAAR